jgi:hypothetical protein
MNIAAANAKMNMQNTAITALFFAFSTLSPPILKTKSAGQCPLTAVT